MSIVHVQVGDGTGITIYPGAGGRIGKVHVVVWCDEDEVYALLTKAQAKQVVAALNAFLEEGA